MARGEVGSGGDVTTTVTTLSDWPPVLHAIAARTVVKSAIRVEVIVAPRLIRGQLDCIRVTGIATVDRSPDWSCWSRRAPNGLEMSRPAIQG